ncbi:hypothetical protein B0H15DRAFT_932399, partial [Mycena belliarum]
MDPDNGPRNVGERWGARAKSEMVPVDIVQALQMELRKPGRLPDSCQGRYRGRLRGVGGRRSCRNIAAPYLKKIWVKVGDRGVYGGGTGVHESAGYSLEAPETRAVTIQFDAKDAGCLGYSPGLLFAKFLKMHANTLYAVPAPVRHKQGHQESTYSPLMASMSCRRTGRPGGAGEQNRHGGSKAELHAFLIRSAGATQPWQDLGLNGTQSKRVKGTPRCIRRVLSGFAAAGNCPQRFRELQSRKGPSSMYIAATWIPLVYGFFEDRYMPVPEICSDELLECFDFGHPGRDASVMDSRVTENRNYTTYRHPANH